MIRYPDPLMRFCKQKLSIRMIQIIKRYLYAVLLFSCTATMTSCLEEAPEARQADQLFRPVLFTATVSGNMVELDWIPIKGATYQLEVSRDSLMFQQDLQVIPLEGIAYFLLEDLWSTTVYSARIKSVSGQPGIKDSEYSAVTFTTGIENIFYTVDSSAISSDSVSLSWDPSKIVSRIEVAAGEEVVRTVELTSPEISEGSRTITGLKENTTYIFRIYNGEMLRGSVTVTTPAGT